MDFPSVLSDGALSPTTITTVRDGDADESESDAETSFRRTGSGSVSASTTMDSPKKGFLGFVRAYSKFKKTIRPRAALSASMLESKLNLNQLLILREKFEENDELDIDEFLSALKPLMGHLMTEEQMRQWFMRVDANGNGMVDWHEFVDHLTLDNPEETEYLMHKDYTAQTKQDLVASTHRSVVSKICSAGQNYITTDESGSIKVWNGSNLDFVQSFPEITTSCISDACVYNDDRILIVASLDRVINFIDINSMKVIRRYIGYRSEQSMGLLNKTRKHLKPLLPQLSKQSTNTSKMSQSSVETICLPHALDPPSCFITVRSPERDSLCVGYQDGTVQLIPIINLHRKIFSNVTDTMKERDCTRITNHTSSVSAVKHMHDIGFLSSSWDKSIHITSLEDGRVAQTLVFEGHDKSIFDVATYEMRKLFASCGADKYILLWNPFIRKPIFKLNLDSCHSSQVAFSELNEQLITLGSDSVIRVWDLRTHRVFQEIPENSTQKLMTNQDTTQARSDIFSCMHFDQSTQKIVACSTRPTSWIIRRSLYTRNSVYSGHDDAFLGAVFNDHFDNVVSIDASVAIVWDYQTGHKNVSFKSRLSGTHTAYALDYFERRFLIGTSDGNVSAWNFVSGQQLKKMQNAGNVEIRHVRHVVREQQNMRYTFAASKQCLFTWLEKDGYIDPLTYAVNLPNGYSVTCIEFCPPLTLAVGTDKGYILLYNINSLQLQMVIASGVGKRGKGAIESFLAKSASDDSGTDGVSFIEKDTEKAVPKRSIEGMALLWEKDIVVSVGDDSSVLFWDLRDGEMILEYDCDYFEGQSYSIVCCNATQTNLAIADDLGYVFLYDVNGIPPLKVSNAARHIDKKNITIMTYFIASDTALSAVQFCGSKNLILTSSINDSSVKLFSLEGVFIGQFGQKESWNIGDPSTYAEEVPNIFNGKGRKMIRDPMREMKKSRRHTKKHIKLGDILMGAYGNNEVDSGEVTGAYTETTADRSPGSTFLTSVQDITLEQNSISDSDSDAAEEEEEEEEVETRKLPSLTRFKASYIRSNDAEQSKQPKFKNGKLTIERTRRVPIIRSPRRKRKAAVNYAMKLLKRVHEDIYEKGGVYRDRNQTYRSDIKYNINKLKVGVDENANPNKDSAANSVVLMKSQKDGEVASHQVSLRVHLDEQDEDDDFVPDFSGIESTTDFPSQGEDLPLLITPSERRRVMFANISAMTESVKKEGPSHRPSHSRVDSSILKNSNIITDYLNSRKYKKHLQHTLQGQASKHHAEGIAVSQIIRQATQNGQSWMGRSVSLLPLQAVKTVSDPYSKWSKYGMRLNKISKEMHIEEKKTH